EDVIYILSVNTVYKEEPDEEYPQKLSIFTGGNSALCGVTLQLGEEYLLGLYRSGPSFFNPEQEGQLRASICDLVLIGSAVTEEDEAALE
ncbi:unnamed protein product, partial [Laminaria digitata]